MPGPEPTRYGGGAERAQLEEAATLQLVNGEPARRRNPPRGIRESGIRPVEEAPMSRRSSALAAGWDRYEILGAIGKGGMGEVYKARDPRLDRHVALKFLLDDDPSLVAHFFREAKAQARIDHPNVCKVYEVGEVHGHPFLVMQLIDGQPLGEAMQGMSLEQRVQVIRDVAEGLHAAHRLGLIHRDVKPGNVLVERSSEGGFHPYLVDFGLAREIKGDAETLFNVEGTPCYMSPEQVAGDLRLLDRRTDVYGLGATLYEALTGEPPYAGYPPLEVIWKVRTEQPRLPREIDRRIPMDLETIVLRCMEKEPQRRYDSARAVAEELQRYLDGEPIRARRSGVTYRAWRKAKKHRVAVALASAAIAALVAIGGVAVRARISAAEQAEKAQEVGILAQELGQDVKEMELFMRYVYALPLHDTSREKALVRARLEDIERRMMASRERLGPLGEGPGHYALGRGLLALGEVEEAVMHLEMALSQGFTTPEARLSAGRARGMLYTAALDQARRLPSREARSARLQEISREHLEPALRYLRESVAGAKAPSHETAALVALYEGRLDEAYAEAERAFLDAPWSYEARKIQGDALRARAALAEERGAPDQALSDLRKAIALYAEAEGMATSDPMVHDAQAEAWNGVMRIERLRGADIRDAYDRVNRSCERATTAEPKLASAHARRAWAHTYYAEHLLSRGADPRDAVSAAIASAEEAVRWGGRDPAAYNSLGAAYGLRAFYEASVGRDAGASLSRAIENSRRALAIDPNDGWAHNDIAIALGLQGHHAALRGEDPLTLFSACATHFDRAIALSPSDVAPRANLAWFYAQRARYELDHGIDPGPSVAQAIAYAEGALQIRGDHYNSHNNLGLTHTLLALHRLEVGGDAAEPIARAREAFEAALRLSPADVEARRGLGAAHAASARERLARGEDPGAALRAGRQAFEGALASAAADSEAQLGLGELEITAARAAIGAGRSPQRAFEAAEAALRRAHDLNPRSAPALAALAALHRDRAAWSLDRGVPAGRDVEEGLRRVARALEVNATMPAYKALAASLRALEARSAGDAAARAGALQRARDELAAALRGNRFLEREYRPMLADIEAKLSGGETRAASARPDGTGSSP